MDQFAGQSPSPWKSFLMVLSGLIGLYTLHHYFQRATNPTYTTVRSPKALSANTSRRSGTLKSKRYKIPAIFRPCVLAKHIIGLQPDCALDVSPRWLVFKSPSEFRFDWLFTTITVTNRDPFAVAWVIKGKQNLDMFRLSHTYGLLGPGQSEIIKVVLTSADRWDREPWTVMNRRQSFLIKNVRIPNELAHVSKKERAMVSREIWVRTNSKNPLQRLYTKIFAVLIKDDQ